MIKFVTKKRQKSLILFIHGFMGGKDTWKSANGNYFFNMIAEEELIGNNFDIAYFEYFTTLTDFHAQIKAGGGWINSLFSNHYHKPIKKKY